MLGLVAGFSVAQVQVAIARCVIHQNGTGLVADFDGTQQVHAAVGQFGRSEHAVVVGCQTVDDGAHARAADVGQFLPGEIHPLDQTAAVDPFGAFVPAFHRGRLQQSLAHIKHVVGDFLDAQSRRLIAPGHPDRADNHLHRALHSGEPGLRGLEVFGVEQSPEHVPDLVARLEVRFHHRVDGPASLLGDLIGGEELEQPCADELGSGVLLGDDVDDVFTVEVAGLAQEGLLAVVVVFLAVVKVPGDAAVGPDGVLVGPDRHVLRVGQGPAGEGAGTFLDVVLGVVADAHGEKLQQLPAVILVDGVAVVVVVVQPDQHRRVAGNLQQKLVEAPQPGAAEHLDLVELGAGLVELGVTSS